MRSVWFNSVLSRFTEFFLNFYRVSLASSSVLPSLDHVVLGCTGYDNKFDFNLPQVEFADFPKIVTENGRVSKFLLIIWFVVMYRVLPSFTWIFDLC